MFLNSFKRLKPFIALLVLLPVLSLIFMTSSLFIMRCKLEVKVKTLQPKLNQDNNNNVGEITDKHLKHLSQLGQDFRKSLDLYEAEKIHLRQRIKVVQKTSLLNLVSHRKSQRQNIVCSKDLFLLIQIHSSPKNFMSRQAIRLSWGGMEHSIGDPQVNIGQRTWKTIFLIAKSSDPKINHLVAQEVAMYKDIVIGSFEDTFHNLYKKMIFSITWPLEQNCNASYILKTDEDCFVNVGNLVNWLYNYHITNGTQPIYAGRVQDRMPVIRDNTSRYYVSEKEFPKPYFYPYASGGGYVFSGNLLPLLSEVSNITPLFPVEDALLGYLMRRIGVSPTDNTKFLPLVFCKGGRHKFQEVNMCSLSKQIILHGIKGKEQLKMHFNSALFNSVSSFCSALQSSSNDEEIRNQCVNTATNDFVFDRSFLDT